MNYKSIADRIDSEVLGNALCAQALDKIVVVLQEEFADLVEEAENLRENMSGE